jgi:hypothetical protein
MTRMILGEVCKSWDSSLCGYLTQQTSLSCLDLLLLFFSSMARQPYMGLGLLVSSRFHDHTLLRHTTLGRTPLDEWPARRRDLYLTTHNTHNRQTSMPPVGLFFFPVPFFSLWSILYRLNPSVLLHVTYVPYYRPYNKHSTNIHASGGIFFLY